MKETQEYDLLQHIKFCLECKNEAQAIRLIEKYGFVKQEERYTEQELKLWLKHRDVYLYNHYTTYVKSGLPLQSVEDFIDSSFCFRMCFLLFSSICVCLFFSKSMFLYMFNVLAKFLF
jgi:cellulose synthase/poly-beta-1,6-N-acetylglucosamine synthase-like glycosyltransferase